MTNSAFVSQIGATGPIGATGSTGATGPTSTLGAIGYAQITANQTGFTSAADVTSLTLTFTAVVSRRYRVSVEAFLSGSNAGDIGSLLITNGAGTQLQSSQLVIPSGGQAIKTQLSFIVVPGAGSTTFKVQAQRASGSGTVNVVALSTAPGFILVEDIGV